MSCFERQGIKWWRALPAVERAYNDSIHSVTGYTPFYMNFGRHPLPDIQSLLEPEAEQLIEKFIHDVQSELARVHEDVAEKMLQKSIRDTAKRNALRSPTIDYKIGDYVYLETSVMRKTPALSPLRSGPYKVEQVLSNGNSVLLEGFRHPFSVELITPTFAFPGMWPHLTKHLIDEAAIGPNEDDVLQTTSAHDIHNGLHDTLDLTQEPEAHAVLDVHEEGNEPHELTDDDDDDIEIIESVGIPNDEKEMVHNFVEDSTELWEFQPMARVGPTTIKLEPEVPVRVANHDDQVGIVSDDNQEVVDTSSSAKTRSRLRGPRASQRSEMFALSDYNNAPSSDIIPINSLIVLPAQLPVSQLQILDIQSKSGSRSSSTVIFTGETGLKYSIGYRHLASILGEEKFKLAIDAYEKKS